MPIEISDDESLSLLCKKQSESAQKALYMRFGDEMLMLCMRYVTNTDDARDIALDGFVTCFMQIGKFEYRGPGSLRAWLRQIMVNQCLMFLRKRKLTFLNIEQTFSDWEPADEGSVIDVMSAKEILQLIHQLPEGCRVIFNLYVFENRTHAEIASQLHISEGTSKSQLHFAKAILRRRIVRHY